MNILTRSLTSASSAWISVCLTLTIILTSSYTCNALQIEAIDSAGAPPQINETIQNNPDYLISMLEMQLRQGRLLNMASTARLLNTIRPDFPDTNAYLAIAQASSNESSKAKESLILARQKSDSKSFLLLCAEAMVLRIDKNYTLALKKIQSALNLSPDHPYALNILGRIQLDQERYPEARESFERVIQLEPDFLPAHLNLGATAFFAKDFQAAEKYFLSALTLEKNNSSAFIGLFLLYEETGDFHKAANSFALAYPQMQNDPELLAKYGKLQLQAKDYNGANKTGQQLSMIGSDSSCSIQAEALLHLGQPEKVIQLCANEKYSNDIITLYAKGYAHMLLGEFTQALNMMDIILQQDPSNFGASSTKLVLSFQQKNMSAERVNTAHEWPPSYLKLIAYIRGNISFTLGDYHQAYIFWTQADNFVPGFSVTGIEESSLDKVLKPEEVPILNRGILYFLRDIDRATEEFKTLTEMNDNSLFGYFWLSQVFLKQNKRTEAIAALHKVIAISPKLFSGLYTLAELYFLSGNAEKAAEYYKLALNTKADAGVCIKLGLLYENQMNFTEAAKYYQQAITEKPDYYVSYNQLAWLLAKQGKELDKATELAEKANRMRPDNASILDTIGWIYFHQKRYDEAKQLFEKSLAIIPNNPSVLYHLGSVEHALGNKAQAVSKLKAALGTNISFDQQNEAQALLQSMQ